MSLYLVAVMLTYTIQSYPGIMVVLDIIEKHDHEVVPTKETLKKVETITRPVFALITCKLLSTLSLKRSVQRFSRKAAITMLHVIIE